MSTPKDEITGKKMPNVTNEPPKLTPQSDTSIFSLPSLTTENSQKISTTKSKTIDLNALMKNLPKISKRLETEGSDGKPMVLEITPGFALGIQTDQHGNITSYGLALNGQPMEYRDISHHKLSVGDFMKSLGEAMIKKAGKDAGEDGRLPAETSFNDFFENVKKDLESKYPNQGVSDKPEPTSLVF